MLQEQLEHTTTLFFLYVFIEYEQQAILDADSKAQAKALMIKLPFYKYLDFKFSPIVSAEDRLAEAKK